MVISKAGNIRRSRVTEVSRRASRIGEPAVRIMPHCQSTRGVCMREMGAAKPLSSRPGSSRPVLGRPEQVLYGRLVRAFPGHVILAHVAVSRLLAVDPAASATEGPALVSRRRQLVADFVVCRPDF